VGSMSQAVSSLLVNKQREGFLAKPDGKNSRKLTSARRLALSFRQNHQHGANAGLLPHGRSLLSQRRAESLETEHDLLAVDAWDGHDGKEVFHRGCRLPLGNERQ
jgi:ribosomal protein L34